MMSMSTTITTTASATTRSAPVTTITTTPTRCSPAGAPRRSPPTRRRLDTGDYGAILRAKGIVPSGGKWLHFDYVPEEQDVRYGSADYTGRLCVIGAQLKEDKLKELFSL